MGRGKDKIPTREEIERQLVRILESEAFRGAARRAAFLRYVLKRALAKRRIDEKDIADAVFGGYDDQSTNVRTTANHLRGRLAEYYAGAGINDLIIIGLPPGRAYKPSISYNPRSLADQKYRRGLEVLWSQQPEKMRDALQEFEEALAIQPDFADAYIATAETLCLLTLHDHRSAPMPLLAEASNAAQKAVSTAPKLWRTQAVCGIVHFLRRQWDEASLAFERALKLDRKSLRRYPGYHAYLLAIGRSQEALELTESLAANESQDVIAQTIFGACTYLSRTKIDSGPTFNKRLITAEAVLKTAIQSNPGFWLAHLVIGFVYLALDRPHDAVRCAQVLKIIAGADLWPGFLPLCLLRLDYAGGGNYQDLQMAQRQLTELHCASEEGQGYFHPRQVALAGNYRGRDWYLWLDRSFKEGDPLMLWLHIWPVFSQFHSASRANKLFFRPPQVPQTVD